MTIKIPTPSMADRFLYLIGKKRGVLIPDIPSSDQSKFVYAVAKKESFFKALFRSRNSPLPASHIDIFEIRGTEFGGQDT